MSSNARFFWGLLLLCLLALAAITLLAGQIFEHVPHSEDEVAYLFQAKVFAQNRLAVPTPAQPPHINPWSPTTLLREAADAQSSCNRM